MKLVILDRDGVINYDSDAFIKSPEEWLPIPGSLEAIARLNHAGYQVVVATNQSGIGRKYFTEQTLQAIHTKMLTAVESVGGHIAKIYYCPHAPQAHCNCRKPETGLFQQISSDFKPAWPQVFNIGDSLRDMQTGLSMGCQNILVRTGKGLKTLNNIQPLPDHITVLNDLSEAADYIIDRKASK